MSEPYAVLGFDFGLKRIGVAVGQSLTASATPLEVIANTDAESLWRRLDVLVAEWRPRLFVLGLPLHADGSATPIDTAIKDFGNQLQKRYNLAVEWIDERLSSSEARDIPQITGKQKAAKGNRNVFIDHIAAKVILETWFRQQGS